MKYPIKKGVRLETNLRNVILKEYYDFLNIFFKKNLNIFPPYQKYNYKIILEIK